MADPKERFKQFVGAESGGGRPKGKGYITERQRINLQPAYLDYLVDKNKKRGHFPKRVSDDKWKQVQEDYKKKNAAPQVKGNNKKGKAKASKPKTKNTAVPSVEPPQNVRRSARLKNKKKK